MINNIITMTNHWSDKTKYLPNYKTLKDISGFKMMLSVTLTGRFEKSIMAD